MLRILFKVGPKETNNRYNNKNAFELIPHPAQVKENEARQTAFAQHLALARKIELSFVRAGSALFD